MTTALRMESIQKNYGARHALDIELLELMPGEQVACRGESGSGKTTLLHLAAGIIRPDSGRILIGDTDTTNLTEPRLDRLRAERIGIVYQTFHLLQGFSAIENVELAMSFGGGIDEARARNILGRVGLGDRLADPPSRLSVGQQQRVAVARALANKPQLVLADEPTGSLDPVRAREALALLKEICAEHNAALLVVTHDPSVIDAFERHIDLNVINRV